jgi:G:T/U-mismatch repair DNA glycosylase
MFLHKHPYEPFVPKGTTRLIVGTIPPPRFSTGDLFDEDVNFCYGSKRGGLWPLLDEIFHLGLEYRNTEKAIKQRKDFLQMNHIGICDIVEGCERQKIDASDLGMKNIELRDILSVLTEHPLVETLFFMGGNSKNAPEYLFRKILKKHNIKMRIISGEVPKIHQFEYDNRLYKTVSLTSPSSAANRSIGASNLFKERKETDENYTTFLFRLDQYMSFFID